MGKVREITGVKAQRQGVAAGQEAQERQGQAAIEQQEQALERILEIQEPFRAVGEEALTGIMGEILPQQDFQLQTDPSRVLRNPFFRALAAEQEQRLMASQAARGKVGAGETTDLLQRNLLQLGSQFQQQDIANQLAQQQAQLGTQAQRFGQLFNVGTLGANVASQQATATQASAANVGNLLTGIGNVQAAGAIQGANLLGESQAQLFNQLTGAGLGAAAGGAGLMGAGTGAGAGALFGFLSDETQKDIIRPVRVDDDGLTVYEFKYKSDPDSVYHGKMAQDIQRVDASHVMESDGKLFVTEKYRPTKVA